MHFYLRFIFRENAYVRVFGHINTYQGTRTIVAAAMSLISDFNEITHHLLEVMKTHSTNSAGAKVSAALVFDE